MCLPLIQEIPQQAHQHLRPKPKSADLEVEANLDLQEKIFYSQYSNINKQGIFLQFSCRGLVSRLFPIDGS